MTSPRARRRRPMLDLGGHRALRALRLLLRARRAACPRSSPGAASPSRLLPGLLVAFATYLVAFYYRELCPDAAFTWDLEPHLPPIRPLSREKRSSRVTLPAYLARAFGGCPRSGVVVDELRAGAVTPGTVADARTSLGRHAHARVVAQGAVTLPERRPSSSTGAGRRQRTQIGVRTSAPLRRNVASLT